MLRPCQHARTAHWGEPLPRCVPMRATGGSHCGGTRRPVMLGGWGLRALHRRFGDLLFPTWREGHRQEMGLDVPQGRRGGAPGRTPCPPHHSGHSLVLALPSSQRRAARALLSPGMAPCRSHHCHPSREDESVSRFGRSPRWPPRSPGLLWLSRCHGASACPSRERHPAPAPGRTGHREPRTRWRPG